MLARSVLRRAFSIELRRNALRVENQNKTWNHLELERHSDALGYGLLDLGFRRGDKLVTWFDPKHGTEIITTQYGCFKAGVHLIPVFGTSSEEFVETVKSSGAKGAFFSPNRRVEGNQKIRGIEDSYTQLTEDHNGNPISLRGLPDLRFLVHNGFYSIPGTYKFRDILFYANRNFVKEQFDLDPKGDSPVIGSGKNLYTVQRIEEAASRTQKLSGETIAVLGDPNCPRVFAEGIYPAIRSEKYAILFAEESEANAAQVLKHIINPIVVHGKGANERVVENLKSLGINQFLNLTA